MLSALAIRSPERARPGALTRDERQVPGMADPRDERKHVALAALPGSRRTPPGSSGGGIASRWCSSSGVAERTTGPGGPVIRSTSMSTVR